MAPCGPSMARVILLLSSREEWEEVGSANWESMLVMGPVRFLATRVMLWLSWLAEATVKGLKRRSKVKDLDAGYLLVRPSGGILR